jgi:cytokinin dehydrogenase
MEHDMIPNRRTLLCAGLGATAGLVSSTGDATPAIGGGLSRDPDVLSAAASDFGRLVHRPPSAVYRPASGEDVAGLLRWAAERGLKVAARGQGHSTYGRAMTEGGIVVDMNALNAVRDLQSDRVVVDAGATWQSVLDAALTRGLTPPVLTNYLGLSVGGTIAVGGIGGSSSQHGMQTDQVLELEVATGDGRRLTCSPTSEAALFDAVRAGLGQCGIVTRATLGLVRAPERVRRYQLFYRDLSSLVADQRRVLADDRFDQLQGAILPDDRRGWRYQLEGAVFYNGVTAPDDGSVLETLRDDRKAAVITDLGYRDDAVAFAKLESVLRQNGQWFHPKPWLTTFLPADTAEQVVREIVDELGSDDLGPFGRIIYYPIFSRAIRTPLVRMPVGDVVFPFNLIRIPAAGDAERAEHMVAQNRIFYDRVRSAGGILYPVSALQMSADDWKEHFRSSWRLIGEAVRRYDPHKMLTPGYNLF